MIITSRAWQKRPRVSQHKKRVEKLFRHFSGFPKAVYLYYHKVFFYVFAE